MEKYIIGLNFRSILPDSIRFPSSDVEKLRDYFSYAYNYTEDDKTYLYKIVNDSFPDEELMHRYKIERYREDINEEVEAILAKTKKDSLVVLDSIYQVYYRTSPKRKPEFPIDIDLMLGLTNDARFIPFLEERYADGYQKAVFALARMGVEPYRRRVLSANVIDSIRVYKTPLFPPNSIHYNPALLLYLCSEEALNLYLDFILQNDDIDTYHLEGVLKVLSPNDETGLDRNYEYQAVRDLSYLLKHLKDSTLLNDYDTYIKGMKNALLREIKDLPEKEKFTYSQFIAIEFPFRSSYADLQKIRAFVAQNRDRLTNPANYKCPDYWKIEAGTEDFRTRYQRYR